MPSIIQKAMKDLEKNDLFQCDLSGTVQKAENKINDEQLIKLADQIGNHANIEELNLSGNLITDRGAIALAKALAGHPKLLILNLSDNQIGPAGAAAIAQMLIVKSPLLTINLQQNPIKDDGARALALALPENKTLTRLILNNSGITVKGAEAFLPALKNNYVLYELSFGEQLLKNGNEQEGKEIINRVIARKNAVLAKVKEFLVASEKGDLVKINSLLSGDTKQNSADEIVQVSVQCADEKGNTGLHKAAQAGNLEVIKLLLSKGAILMRNRDIDRSTELGKKYGLGKTPLDIAQACGHIAIVGELKNRPSAIVPVANQLRRLRDQGYKSNDGTVINTALADAIINDTEHLLQAQTNVITYMDQRLTSELDENKSDITELQKHREETDAKLELLLKLHNEDQQRKIIITRFKQNDNLIIFYRTTQIKLCEIFTACRALSTGFMAHTRSGDLSNIASGVDLLGQVISLIPMVGDKAQTVSGIISGQLRDVDYQQQLNLIKAMSLLLTNEEQNQAAEEVARLLGHRFTKQLVLLNSLIQAKETFKQAQEQAGFFKKMIRSVTQAKAETEDFIYKAAPKTFAQLVAEFAVLRILEALQNQQIIVPGHPQYSAKTLSVAEQLFEAVVYTPSANTTANSGFNPINAVSQVINAIQNRISDLLGKDQLTTTDRKIWKLGDFFIKPGIMTSQGEYYFAPHSDVNLYDYRLGSKDEALRLNYRLNPSLSSAANRTTDAPTSHAAPKSHSQAVNQGAPISQPVSGQNPATPFGEQRGLLFSPPYKAPAQQTPAYPYNQAYGAPPSQTPGYPYSQSYGAQVPQPQGYFYNQGPVQQPPGYGYSYGQPYGAPAPQTPGYPYGQSSTGIPAQQPTAGTNKPQAAYPKSQGYRP